MLSSRHRPHLHTSPLLSSQRLLLPARSQQEGPASLLGLLVSCTTPTFASIVASLLSFLIAEKLFPMASTLLNCSICPKHPTFSDTSHLLTHISSKGHLSYLHKLQVRSHQEVGAGNQLATYHQWYQQHDLGRLLSERMLQKEAKRSSKKRRSTQSSKKIKKEHADDLGNAAPGARSLAIDPGLHQTPVLRGAGQKAYNDSNPFLLDDDSDYESSPVKKHA